MKHRSMAIFLTGVFISTLLSSTSVSAQQTITVRAKEFGFEPGTINVKSGQKVKLVLKNAGTIVHNLAIKELGVKTATIRAGDTYTLEFTPQRAGRFTFVCTLRGHANRGMIGTIVVE